MRTEKLRNSNGAYTEKRIPRVPPTCFMNDGVLGFLVFSLSPCCYLYKSRCQETVSCLTKFPPVRFLLQSKVSSAANGKGADKERAWPLSVRVPFCTFQAYSRRSLTSSTEKGEQRKGVDRWQPGRVRRQYRPARAFAN